MVKAIFKIITWCNTRCVAAELLSNELIIKKTKKSRKKYKNEKYNVEH